MKAHIASALAVVTTLALTGCGGGVDVNFQPSFPPVPPTRNTDFVARAPIDVTLASAGRTRLMLTNVNGSIVVNGTSAGSSVVIEGERRVGSDSLADAQAQLPQLQVKVEEAGSDVVIKTVPPEFPDGRSYTVDYVISVPASFAVSIVNVNGSIALSGMAGNVDTSLVNGPTEATLQVPAGGSVSMAVTNGDIDLHLPLNTSASLSAQVSIGTILVQDLLVQNEVRTNTSLQGTLGTGGATVSLKTTTGSIRIDGLT
jgi:hypothetical protein